MGTFSMTYLAASQRDCRKTGQEKTQSIRHIKRSEETGSYLDERISKGNGKNWGGSELVGKTCRCWLLSLPRIRAFCPWKLHFDGLGHVTYIASSWILHLRAGARDGGGGCGIQLWYLRKWLPPVLGLMTHTENVWWLKGTWNICPFELDPSLRSSASMKKSMAHLNPPSPLFHPQASPSDPVLLVPCSGLCSRCVPIPSSTPTKQSYPFVPTFSSKPSPPWHLWSSFPVGLYHYLR